MTAPTNDHLFLSPMATQGPLLRAYVDETGDRGVSASSSQFFAMAGVVIADADEPEMRSVVRNCRAKLTVPSNKPMHWREHVKTFARRQFVTSQLTQVPLVVNYVVFEKAAIPTSSGLRADHAVFYNYAAKLMLERLLLTAADWTSNPRPVVATFGHVRGFDHGNTLAYLKTMEAQGRRHSRDHWRLLHGAVRWSGAGEYDGLQVADQYAGMLSAALCPDPFGGYEAQHLLAVRHQIRRHRAQAWGAGFKVMAQPGTMSAYPWWPSGGM